MFGRRKVAALVAEFLGTGVLTLLILSVQRSTIGVPFFVAAAAGLTLAAMTFALAGASGGYFNPALTLGQWAARQINTISTILFIAMQLLGAWAAYGLYTYFVNNSLQDVGGDYSTRVLVAEAVGTGIFAFGAAAALTQGLTRSAVAAFSGLSLMLGAIAASSASLGLLNPAVALGTRAWVWGTYVLGPILGGVIGYNLYLQLFADRPLATATPVAAKAAATVAAKKKPVAKKKAPVRKK